MKKRNYCFLKINHRLVQIITVICIVFISSCTNPDHELVYAMEGVSVLNVNNILYEWVSHEKNGQQKRGQPDTSNIQKLDETIDPEIQNLADRICNQMILARSSEEPMHEVFESETLKHLGISKETPNYRAQITSFWNKNKDKLICTKEIIGYKSPQHLYKRVIELGAINDFYFDYSLKDSNVDVNAIEYVDGEPETVIDYIDKILEDPAVERLYNVHILRSLRGYLTTFVGAKKGEELIKN